MRTIWLLSVWQPVLENTDITILQVPGIVQWRYHLPMSMPALARLGGEHVKLVNQYALASQTLVGLVDLHIHLAAHLGFGRKLFYGPPDDYPAQVFADCNGFHGQWGIDNPERNYIRNAAADTIAALQYSTAWVHNYPGRPGFPAWPHGMIGFISRFGSRCLSARRIRQRPPERRTHGANHVMSSQNVEAKQHQYVYQCGLCGTRKQRRAWSES
jgi:hypothetical protein